MTNDRTMSRWVCEHCGYKNHPIFSNCAKCLRGYDDDLMEPLMTMHYEPKPTEAQDLHGVPSNG